MQRAKQSAKGAALFSKTSVCSLNGLRLPSTGVGFWNYEGVLPFARQISTDRQFNRSSSPSAWLDLESPRRHNSEPFLRSWTARHSLNAGGTNPQTGASDWIQRGKGAESLHLPLGFLTADSTWIASSHSCCHAVSAMMDCCDGPHTHTVSQNKLLCSQVAFVGDVVMVMTTVASGSLPFFFCTLILRKIHPKISGGCLKAQMT